MENKRRGGESHQNYFVQLAELLQQFMGEHPEEESERAEEKERRGVGGHIEEEEAGRGGEREVRVI